MFRILQIDDQDSILMLVERLLTSRPGFESLSAENGRDGLALATAHHPDLILLDVGMPEMGGEEVLARLKADPGTADIPVMILSGSGHDEMIEFMLDHGAAGYLPKPFTAQALYAVVDAFQHAAQPLASRASSAA